jgi:hypothetical protein
VRVADAAASKSDALGMFGPRLAAPAQSRASECTAVRIQSHPLAVGGPPRRTTRRKADQALAGRRGREMDQSPTISRFESGARYHRDRHSPVVIISAIASHLARHRPDRRLSDSFATTAELPTKSRRLVKRQELTSYLAAVQRHPFAYRAALIGAGVAAGHHRGPLGQP